EAASWALAAGFGAIRGTVGRDGRGPRRGYPIDGGRWKQTTPPRAGGPVPRRKLCPERANGWRRKCSTLRPRLWPSRPWAPATTLIWCPQENTRPPLPHHWRVAFRLAVAFRKEHQDAHYGFIQPCSR